LKKKKIIPRKKLSRKLQRFNSKNQKKCSQKKKVESNKFMAELFDSLIHKGYGRILPTRQRLSPGQLSCRNFVQQNLKIILFSKLRERYLRDIVICVAGYQGSDQDEPLTISHFSQLQFFEAYDELIYFVDKFDFLIQCLSYGVCNVSEGFEARFRETMLRVMVGGVNQYDLNRSNSHVKKTSDDDDDSSSTSTNFCDEENDEFELDLNSFDGPVEERHENRKNQHHQRQLDENGFVIKKKKIQILDPVPERHTKQERRQWTAAQFRQRLKSEEEMLQQEEENENLCTTKMVVTVAEQGLIEADEQKDRALQFAQERFFEKKIVQY
jgi:hypothetical protein